MQPKEILSTISKYLNQDLQKSPGPFITIILQCIPTLDCLVKLEYNVDPACKAYTCFWHRMHQPILQYLTWITLFIFFYQASYSSIFIYVYINYTVTFSLTIWHKYFLLICKYNCNYGRNVSLKFLQVYKAFYYNNW